MEENEKKKKNKKKPQKNEIENRYFNWVKCQAE